MTQAQIQELFKQRYNQSNWKKFLAENFAGAQLLAAPKTLTGINAEVAVQALLLGHVQLVGESIERTIAVYEVTLAPGIVLERNRVGLRNLLRKYWKEIDGAFIVYHRPESANWRFTYVSELTGWDEEGEQVKIKTEPKRYTYVLGEGETVRTAAERFTILAAKGGSVTLDHVKEAFSVEKLSKAFFDEYKQHYQEICQYLIRSGFSKSVFNGDEKAIRDFSKKLLGRIVFLYFIQKKGWLGVAKNAMWGTGDKAFLSKLYEQAQHKELFYQEYLCKLFFDTLNAPQRPDELIELIRGQPCRIPFLNGGLFDEGKDKKHRSLVFDKNLFANLFGFFNQYNFTIYEDDPNDHTVAVDPEMLGHIFENLLEDNKDKGAFYTPKEIVHYMCQESLIEYLTTWFENKGYEITGYTGLDKSDKAQLFPINQRRKGQLIIEAPTQTTARRIDRSLIEKLLKKQLEDEDKALVLKHRHEFEKALDNVKICDPAIGSGAFPMGLLHEIFTTKQTLYTFANGNTQGFDASGVKLNIIQNSIYGVDIESGAVDIARLRFWLSLIVDEPEPKALPNLDYKIVVGNSLVSKLGDDIIDIDWETKGSVQADAFAADFVEKRKGILQKISEEQKQFFNPKSNKAQLALDIRNLKIDLLINQLELMIKATGLTGEPKQTSFKDKKKYTQAFELYLQIKGWENHINHLKALKTKPEETLHFFDWKLDFPEVMNEQVVEGKVGFDIVIANPPYIGEKGNKAIFRDVKKTHLNDYYLRKMDYFYFFFHQAINITNSKANIIFITTNYYVTATGARKLREDIFNRTAVLKLINLGEARIFPNALGQHNLITMLSKDKRAEFTKVISTTRKGALSTNEFFSLFHGLDEKTKYQSIDKNSLFYGENQYLRIDLSENVKSDNTIQKILDKIEKHGIAIGEVCNVNQGLRTGADKVSPKHLETYGIGNHYKHGDGIFILKNSEIKNLDLNPFESSKIKPLYKNSDIKKYSVKEETSYCIIDLFWPNDRSLNVSKIPNLLRHFSKFRKILEGRKENANGLDKAIANGLYYFGSVRRKLDFSLPKIVAPQRSKTNTFGYTTKEWFASADVYYITNYENNSKVDLKFILGLLNSKLYFQWLYHKGKRKGDMLELYQKPLSEVPIKLDNNDLIKTISKLVDNILYAKENEINSKAIEEQIDNLVYKLYELTYEEVQVIDPEFSLTEAEYAAIQVDAAPAPGQANQVATPHLTVSVSATPHKVKPNKELTNPIDFNV